MKVRALDTYEKKNIRDDKLGRVPKKGEEFIVDDERAKVLLGNNSFKIPFVEVVEEEKAVKPKVEEKAILPKKKKK